ncbi:DUF262 domain-containing protein [Haladaptatus sp. F3-133]|uniref:DUF262 domain-containing protein n=1 Tax=Halorutilus salinus TaxID=2487751 RepID=A0A9Q4C663_9EURY|nr:DUF262 domain-containing protein [Halorutilus salinus]MCX2819674.1 DUF262 domain-containing protein [Halorutilus salinus]
MVEVENPGTKKVSTLLDDIDDGSYVIPYFQRGFEWEPQMVSELFESILQNYYTGLLLFWELDEARSEQEEWDPVWGAELNSDPEKAVLDGQQRLSSLYYAIHNPSKKFPSRESYYIFYLDLIDALNGEFDEAISYRWKTRNYKGWSELRQERDEWIETGEVPLCILSADDPDDANGEYIGSTEFREWASEFIEENSASLPGDVAPWDIRDILETILDYNFVVYPLDSDRGIDDICNIFAKVNDTGMKLSTFDLMNAFLYPSGIELRKDLWEGLDNDQLKSLDSNMDENLLKIISLRKQNYCSSKYLYNLIPGEETVREEPDGTRYEEVLVESGEEFEELWEEAVGYAEQARSMIMNMGDREFGAIKSDFIPHATILPVLAAILWEYDGQVDETEFKQQLKRWYWSAVFSQDYSGSSDTMMGKDFRDWKSWLETGETIEQISKVDEEFVRELDLKDVDKGSGRYNAIICLIALNGAEDFYRASILGTGDFVDSKINDHHIFPKKVDGLDEETSKTFDSLRDSIVNRTLILDKTNNKIKNRKPSEYLERMEERNGGEQEVKELLENHLISETAYRHLKNNNFDDFVLQRERDLKEEIAGIV